MPAQRPRSQARSGAPPPPPSDRRSCRRPRRLARTATAPPGLDPAPARSGCDAPLRAPQAGPQNASALDCLLQGRARGEPRNAAGRDLDALTRLRVHALTCATIGHGELAEASEVDLSATLERALDDRQNRVDGGPGVTL